MTDAKTLRIRVERRIAASANDIFDAWLDPARAARFLFATPTGQMRRVEIDARVGGGFHIVERRDGHDASHYGVWLELDRPRRLVFAFSIEGAHPHADPGTVDIIPDGDACRVVLTHDMAPEWVDYLDKTEAGWMHILAGLAATLSTEHQESTP